MRRKFLLLSLVFGVSCSAYSGDAEQVDAKQSEIVRGNNEPNRPYVVMIHSEIYGGSVTRCTGTLVAPRVVLTAAHCLRNGRWWHGTFVYYGKDYASDLSLLNKRPIGPSTIGPQSEQNVWAMAEADEAFPSYDANTHYPDLAVLYLDRKPPIDPLPIYRARLDDSWIGKKGTLVGWGANKALSADIKQVEGGGVKRSAQVPILGTPTAADYHEDDPNPGMLDAAIRSHWIKTSGLAPKANTCAGDSGGPMIINKWGQDYVAGVSMWTGLWCEDYSIFTRLESFLPFLDDAYFKSGQAPVVPRLECVEDNADGTYTALLSYRNDNAITIQVPYSQDRNYLPLDTEGVRPSSFLTGDHPLNFFVDFTNGQPFYWKLSPTNSPTTELRASSSSPRCARDSLGSSCLRSCRASIAAACDPPIETRSTLKQCFFNCADVEGFIPPECMESYIGANNCMADQDVNDPALWSCSEGYGGSAIGPACEPIVTELLTCMGW
ncbi:MAG TPA: trypsin-like serine protease [Polyangiaceae bacterium]|nr:trypsin-like serine protease [Polyangiaceae bacterium]